MEVSLSMRCFPLYDVRDLLIAEYNSDCTAITTIGNEYNDCISFDEALREGSTRIIFMGPRRYVVLLNSLC